MKVRYDAKEFAAALRARAAGFLSDASEIDAQLDSKFQLVVLGDFKRGKSTLINALLGVAAAPVDVAPETCTINCFESGDALTVTAELADGGKVDVPSMKREALESLLAKLPAPVEQLRISVPGAASELLREGVLLVDTPGLGEESGGAFDARVRRYLREAEAVVYVISAVSPLSQSEQDFLRSAVAPLEFAKLCFVVNFVDLLPSAHDVDRVLSSIRGKLTRVFPQAAVFGSSALDEWVRVSGSGASREDLAQRFAAFREHLQRSILFHREGVIADRLLTLYRQAVERLDRDAEKKQQVLAMTRAEVAARTAELTTRQQGLASALDAVETKVQAGVGGLLQTAYGWLDEFFARLDNDCIAGLSAQSLSQIRKHLPLFLSDRIRGAVDACWRAQQPEFAAVVEGARNDLGSLEFSGAQPVGNLLWSNMDLVTFVSQYFQLDFLVYLLIGFVRDLEHDTLSADVIGALRERLPELQKQVCSEVERAYRETAGKAVAELRRGYARELESVLTALRAVEDPSAEAAEVAKVREGAAGELAWIEEWRQRLLA